ncbi:serine hydrolase domain-containing protein [Nonomuraea sp. NPDC049129]|uniref:serine hydrolase domain-containing protein n=1 Tax=Nonomuraea sp. NPDC049129 TaxID=3155272 RepID=UPI0033FAC55A
MTANQPSRRTAIGLLGAAPLATGAARAQALRIPDAVRPGGSFDKHIAQLAADDKFSGTVLISYRGKPVLSRAYGMADKEKSIPNRVDTIYPLASASKPFTGLAIVQLAQQGKLKFHEKLGAYLDGYPAETADTVTVHNLLTHTCGLGDPTRDDDISTTVHYSIAEQLAAMRKRLQSQKPAFPPGVKHQYSSAGYEVLGEIVARVSGQTFWDYVRDHIFRPAGMTDSLYYVRPQWLASERFAHPYMYQSDGSRIDGLRNLDKGGSRGVAGTNSARSYIGTGGGNGFSTAPDLVRFAHALLSHKLLNPAYTALYVSGKFPPAPLAGSPPRPGGYESLMAYGPISGIFHDQRVISHGGGIAGGNTNWSVYLDMNWTSAILCNYDLDPADFAAIIDLERRAITGVT